MAPRGKKVRHIRPLEFKNTDESRPFLVVLGPYPESCFIKRNVLIQTVLNCQQERVGIFFLSIMPEAEKPEIVSLMPRMWDPSCL